MTKQKSFFIEEKKAVATSFMVWLICLFFFFLATTDKFSYIKQDGIVGLSILASIILGSLSYIVMFRYLAKIISKKLLTFKFLKVLSFLLFGIVFMLLPLFVLAQYTNYVAQQNKPDQVTNTPTITDTPVIVDTQYNDYVQTTYPTVILPTVETRIPVSLHNGGYYLCDSIGQTAIRDADQALLLAEQQKADCYRRMFDQDRSLFNSCIDNCYSPLIYDYENQSQNDVCANYCRESYNRLHDTSINYCDTFDQAQKANLDNLVQRYCSNSSN
ncbi:MAG: hypothetical protein LC122_07360 [Chitinophagales bacterium]|nr:hypothetical protein [Chitinophagales bacterium]